MGFRSFVSFNRIGFSGASGIDSLFKVILECIKSEFLFLDNDPIYSSPLVHVCGVCMWRGAVCVYVCMYMCVLPKIILILNVFNNLR